jgi:tRNA dimethylallyltransferase
MEIFNEIEEFLKNARQEHKRPLIAIVGPTASGKTALSIHIAKKYDGEIISADSRQFYKYMDIGTDKITKPQMQGIPHHLVDIAEPDTEFTVADFKRAAQKAIDQIHAKNKTPILCGGSGLYLSVLTENYKLPDVSQNPALRKELHELYEKEGTMAVYKVLQELDPKTAEKIHPNNLVYVIRAIEILKGGSEKAGLKDKPLYAVFKIGIDWPRELLYERINSRVEDLMERGLINEVKTLLLKGFKQTMPSMMSIGYSELIEFLNGHVTLAEATEEIKKNTRNYCKRQLTWFKREKDIHWVSGADLQSYLKNNAS